MPFSCLNISRYGRYVVRRKITIESKNRSDSTVRAFSSSGLLSTYYERRRMERISTIFSFFFLIWRSELSMTTDFSRSRWNDDNSMNTETNRGRWTRVEEQTLSSHLWIWFLFAIAPWAFESSIVGNLILGISRFIIANRIMIHECSFHLHPTIVPTATSSSIRAGIRSTFNDSIDLFSYCVMEVLLQNNLCVGYCWIWSVINDLRYSEFQIMLSWSLMFPFQ